MNSSFALNSWSAAASITLTVFAIFSLASCASSNVDQAFSGSLPKADAVKTITEYCQSCHIHKSFDGSKHMADVTAKYKAEPFKSSDTCQTCHTYDKNFWGDELRYTHFPSGVLTTEAANGEK